MYLFIKFNELNLNELNRLNRGRSRIIKTARLAFLPIHKKKIIIRYF